MIVQPPAVLVRMGLVKPGVMWKLNKALYGLRCAPKRWGEKRDAMLKEARCSVGDIEATFEQCETAKGIWKIKSGNRIVGYFMVYVDDVLIHAPTKWVQAVMNTFESLWECKLVGIIVGDGETTVLAVNELVFLSITIEPVTGGYALHQHEYVRTKLAKRAVTKGRAGLPEVDEGSVCPVTTEYKQTNEYKDLLNSAQQEVGSLQWLALKTRPDIACITAICASMQSRNPQKALDITVEIWKYILATKDCVILLVPNSEAENNIRISADASFAPGGDRSRTGVVIKVQDAIVHWSSTKQSLASTSAHEAELNGVVTGTKLGIGIRSIAAELLEVNQTMKLDQDNMATIRTITHEVTSWRTRHYALRAAWIRDIIKDERIRVEHEKGVEICADPLTKVLGKVKLQEALDKLDITKISQQTMSS